MNKEIFENDFIPEAEVPETPQAASPESDFDAELMALLGDDLFKEIVGQKSAPVSQELPAKKPPVKKAPPAKKDAAAQPSAAPKKAPGKKPAAASKAPAQKAADPQTPPAPKKKAAPAAPAKKQKKGPRISGVIFYTLYFMFILVFAVGTFFGLKWVQGWLADYEQAQPTVRAEQVFQQIFTDPNWGDLYTAAGAKDSAYEGKEAYVAYMEEKMAGKKLTYLETSAGLSGNKKYVVRLDNEKVASFTLVDKNKVSSSLSLENLDSITDIPDWQLGSVEVFFERVGSYRIEKMDGHTVYVNGVALDDSFTIMEATTIAANYLPEGLTGVSMCTQEVTGLMEKPSITVVYEDNAQVEVTYDEETRTFTARTESNTITEEQEKVALEALRINCLWMIEELTDRGKVAKYFDSASKPYNDIVHLGELWMQGHAGYEFKNENVSKFASYGSDMFSVSVALDLDVTRKDGTVKTHNVFKTLFFKNFSGKWKVVEWTNEDVSKPVGKVRLTFMDGSTLLTTDLYSNNLKKLTTPTPSAKAGQVFSGWVRETIGEDGSTTLTVMFEPDPVTGEVIIPDGVTLEPMVLYALFEDADDAAQNSVPAETAPAESKEGA